MSGRSLLLSLSCAVALALASPAHAAQPAPTPVDVSQVLTGPTDCGTLRWDIHITGFQTTFFDAEGRRTFAQAHLREDNTITNLTTGESLREGPDAFTQTSSFDPDGRSTGSSRRGWPPTSRASSSRTWAGSCSSRWAAAASISSSPPASTRLREAADDGRLADALPAFCELFD